MRTFVWQIPEPLIRMLLAILRFILSVLYLAFQLSMLLVSSLIFGQTEERGFRFRNRFIRGAKWILGIRSSARGAIPDTPALYVSNHRSLADPLIELEHIPAHVVSKAEVAGYPLIGFGAKATGVIFVQREDQTSRATAKEAIRQALVSGKSVLIFPEGTTSDLPTTNDFKLGSFKVAAQEGISVVPVAIDYRVKADYWFGTPMLRHFLKKFGKWTTDASMSIGPALSDADPRALMEASRSWINTEILAMNQRWT